MSSDDRLMGYFTTFPFLIKSFSVVILVVLLGIAVQAAAAQHRLHSTASSSVTTP
jgi:hypothetical protein